MEILSKPEVGFSKRTIKHTNLGKLTKKKWEQISKIKSKREHYYQTRNIKNGRGILWIVVCQLLDNLDKMDRFLERKTT